MYISLFNLIFHLFRLEDKIRRVEKSITELVDDSCTQASLGEFTRALERAKEASAREKSLIKLQEQSGLSESHNMDITYLVRINLF